MRVGQANLPALWTHPNSSELFIKGWNKNNGIKIGGHEISES
jgi:hypothetical protein